MKRLCWTLTTASRYLIQRPKPDVLVSYGAEEGSNAGSLPSQSTRPLSWLQIGGIRCDDCWRCCDSTRMAEGADRSSWEELLQLKPDAGSDFGRPLVLTASYHYRIPCQRRRLLRMRLIQSRRNRQKSEQIH